MNVEIEEIFRNFKIENCLEKYQLTLIEEMQQNGLNEEEIIQSFLMIPKQKNMQTFGGGKNTLNITLDVVKKEFFELICGDKYATERQKIFDSKTHKSITTGITTKLSLVLSIEQAILYPIIVLLIPLLRKFGCESYKTVQTELENQKISLISDNNND